MWFGYGVDVRYGVQGIVDNKLWCTAIDMIGGNEFGAFALAVGGLQGHGGAVLIGGKTDRLWEVYKYLCFQKKDYLITHKAPPDEEI